MGICFVPIVHILIQSDVDVSMLYETQKLCPFTKQNRGGISYRNHKHIPSQSVCCFWTTHFILLSFSIILRKEIHEEMCMDFT